MCAWFYTPQLPGDAEFSARNPQQRANKPPPHPSSSLHWSVLVRKTGAPSAVKANADWSNPFASTQGESLSVSQLEARREITVALCLSVRILFGRGGDQTILASITPEHRDKKTKQTNKRTPLLGCVDRFNSTQSDHVTSYETHRCSKRQVSRLTLADNRRGVTGQS